jgi:hypothetical protein
VSFLERVVLIGPGHLMQIGINQRAFLLHLHSVQPNLPKVPLLPSLRHPSSNNGAIIQAKRPLQKKFLFCYS